MKESVKIIEVSAWLRFPLCVLVVLIHSGFGLATDSLSLDVPQGILFIIKSTLASFAVPCFFAISGYLFFYHVNRFDFNCYLYKAKRRFKSLLIPYVIWNVFYFLLFAIKAKYFSGSALSGEDVVVYDLKYFITGLWSTLPYSGDNVPIYFAFWFIRDLMVVMLFSPVVYLGIKRMGGWFLLVPAIYSFLGLFNTIPTYIMPLAPLYFSIGCFFSISGIENLRIPKRGFLVMYYLTILALFIAEYQGVGGYYNKRFHHLIVLYGFPSLFFIGQSLMKYVEIKSFFSDASFFVYALHVLYLSIFNKMLFVLIPPSNEILATLLFVFSISIAIFSCCLTHYLLRKVLPVIAKVLSGGR